MESSASCHISGIYRDPHETRMPSQFLGHPMLHRMKETRQREDLLPIVKQRDVARNRMARKNGTKATAAGKQRYLRKSIPRFFAQSRRLRLATTTSHKSNSKGHIKKGRRNHSKLCIAKPTICGPVCHVKTVCSQTSLAERGMFPKTASPPQIRMLKASFAFSEEVSIERILSSICD